MTEDTDSYSDCASVSGKITDMFETDNAIHV